MRTVCQPCWQLGFSRLKLKIQEYLCALVGTGVTKFMTSGSSHLNMRVTPSEAIYLLEVGGGFI